MPGCMYSSLMNVVSLINKVVMLCSHSIFLINLVYFIQGDQRKFKSLSEVEIQHTPKVFQVKLKVRHF